MNGKGKENLSTLSFVVGFKGYGKQEETRNSATKKGQIEVVQTSSVRISDARNHIN